MTQDEIIDMARKAWITSYCAAELKRGGVVDIDLENLEAFAALVAKAEREACAKACEELPAPNFYSDTDQSMWDITSMDCAEAIRARTKEQK